MTRFSDLTAFDPVFVYGAMRSGTTMFRLMLNGHGRIANPGEVDFFFSFLKKDPTHATGWRYDLEALRIDRIFQGSRLLLADGKDGLDLLANFMRQHSEHNPGKILTYNIHHTLAEAVELFPDARIIHMLRDPPGRGLLFHRHGMGPQRILWHRSLDFLREAMGVAERKTARGECSDAPLRASSLGYRATAEGRL